MPLSARFVRHGESTANLHRVFSNRADDPASLTAARVAQAETLAGLLRGIPVTHVYTSLLVRARQTAGFIAGALDVSCEVDDALREYDVGEVEGSFS